jgi:hypothetical protein
MAFTRQDEYPSSSMRDHRQVNAFQFKLSWQHEQGDRIRWKPGLKPGQGDRLVWLASGRFVAGSSGLGNGKVILKSNSG